MYRLEAVGRLTKPHRRFQVSAAKFDHDRIRVTIDYLRVRLVAIVSIELLLDFLQVIKCNAESNSEEPSNTFAH